MRAFIKKELRMIIKWRHIVLASVLTLAGLILILTVGSGPAAGMLDAGRDVSTSYMYLPLVSRSVLTSTQHTLLRPESGYLSRSGDTYAEALTGPVTYQEQPLTTGAWNSPVSEYAEQYQLLRGFTSYDLGELAGREVVSAVLEVQLCTAQTPPETAITLTLQAGTWTGELSAAAWEAVGETYGHLTIPADRQVPETDRWLALPISGPLPQYLRLAWLADESRAYPAGTTVGAAFDLADCYGIGLADDQLTQLHLWVTAP
jgi:hypothetical protein